MAIAANYMVLMDGKKTLPHDFTLECVPPENLAVNWAPVLSFMVDSVGNVDDFEFEVRFQSPATFFAILYKGNYSGNHYHGVHEVMPGNLLLPLQKGFFSFARVSGDGAIAISDVVVWIRVNA